MRCRSDGLVAILRSISSTVRVLQDARVTAVLNAPVPMTGGRDSSWRTQPLAVTPDKSVVGKAQRAMNYCDRHMRKS